MFDERDIKAIKALKKEGESTDDFISRIESACTEIKQRDEQNSKLTAFSEKIREAFDIIQARGVEVDYSDYNKFDPWNSKITATFNF